MPHIKLNWVDIVFITLLFRVGYIGFKNGLLPEFFRFLGLYTAFIVSFNNYTVLTAFLSNYVGKLDVLAFLFIFFAIVIIFKLLSILITKLLGGSENISLANKIAGLILAVGRGLLLIVLICILFIHSPVKYLSRSAEERSLSGPYASRIVPFAYRAGIGLYPWEKIETPLVRLIKR